MPSSSSFLIASQHKQSHKAVGGHLQWTSHCFHHKHLCWACCLTTLAMPPQTMNSSHMLLTRKLCWLIVMTLSNEKKTEKPWGKTHLLQLIDVSSCSDDFEWIPSKVETTSSVLRQWAIKTRPLSNCVLRASASQRTRERNTGIARKNIAMAFEDYLAKEGCLEDPFSKQILRNYQPCVSTPRTLEQHKECVNQQNTVYHKFCPRFLSCSFEGTSDEQLWPWSCSVLENVQWTLGINPRSTTFCTPGRCDFWGCDTIKVNRLEP